MNKKNNLKRDMTFLPMRWRLGGVTAERGTKVHPFFEIGFLQFFIHTFRRMLSFCCKLFFSKSWILPILKKFHKLSKTSRYTINRKKKFSVVNY